MSFKFLTIIALVAVPAFAAGCIINSTEKPANTTPQATGTAAATAAPTDTAAPATPAAPLGQGGKSFRKPKGAAAPVDADAGAVDVDAGAVDVDAGAGDAAG